MNLLACLERNAREQGENPALIFVDGQAEEQTRLSHGELYQQVCGLTVRLQSEGLAGQTLPLIFDGGPDFTIAFFACLATGSVSVPLPPMDASRLPAQLSYISGLLEQVSARNVLSSGESYQLLATGLNDVGLINTGQTQMAPQADLTCIPNQTAALLFTSGSTSAPKGVVIRQNNLAYNARSCCQQWHIDRRSVLISWMPNQHSFGLIYNLLLPLYSGSCLVAASPAEFVARPQLWFEMISKYGGTHGAAATFGYQLCSDRIDPAEIADIGLSTWKVGLISAEPVRRGVCEDFYNRFKSLGLPPHFFCALYGLSETGPITSMPVGQPAVYHASEGTPPQLETACVGPVLPGSQIRIVDTTGNPLAEGISGEVQLAGPSVMDGYLNNETVNAQVFSRTGSQRFFRTGDQGFLLNGGLYLTGRIKEIMIIRGKNYYPQDLESLAREANPTGLGKVAAFSADRGRGEEVTVVIEVGEGLDYPSLTTAAARNILSGLGLSVSRVVLTQMGAIPTTASGKIRRATCKEALESASLPLVFDSRATQLEYQTTKQMLLQLFAEALHLNPDDLDEHANLSDYNMDSMTFTQLADRIGQALKRPVHPNLFFRCETLAELTAYLEGEDGA